jgi:hypothetical protein
LIAAKIGETVRIFRGGLLEGSWAVHVEAAAVALGTGTHSWTEGILARLGKGLIAGFVLGFVYMVVLNVLGISWEPLCSTEEYHRMMWHTGPVAMSVASGLYLILFVWAANLRSTVLRTSDG